MTDDPTRNQRQRLYRARRTARAEGLIEVWIGEDVFFVLPAIAQTIRRLIDHGPP